MHAWRPSRNGSIALSANGRDLMMILNADIARWRLRGRKAFVDVATQNLEDDGLLLGREDRAQPSRVDQQYLLGVAKTRFYVAIDSRERDTVCLLCSRLSHVDDNDEKSIIEALSLLAFQIFWYHLECAQYNHSRNRIMRAVSSESVIKTGS